MATEQIVIEYIAQVEGLKAQLKTVQTELTKTQKVADDTAKNTSKSFAGVGESIRNVGLSIASSIGAAFAVQKIIAFGEASIKAFRESEEVAKKLEFAVTRIGKEGAAAFEKLSKQADKFSKITIFDDESIRKAQTQLVQYGLQSDAIEALIPKILDLASATGQDLGSATDLVIQGVNGQGRALKPYGIILDDTGSKAKNLALVTEGLAKFTGSAGDAFETSAGQAKFFDNQINEIQESIGEKLSPTWDAFKLSFLTGLDQELQKLGDVFDSLSRGLGGDDEVIKQRLEKFSKATSSYQTRVTLELVQKGAERTEIENKLLIEYRKILDKKLAAAEDEETKELGLTQKGIDDKAAAEVQAQKDREQREKGHFDEYIKAVRDRTDEAAKVEKEAEDKKAKEDAEANKKKIDDEKKLREDIAKVKKDALDKEAEDELARDEQQTQARIEAEEIQKQIVIEAVNSIFEYKNQMDEIERQKLDADAELQRQRIDKQVADGVLSEAQGAAAINLINADLEKKKKEIAKEAAKRDKAQSVFNIGLAAAEGVIKALLVPPPAGQILAASIAGLAAVQIAAVLAKPLPFAKGVIDLQGGVRGKDSINAMLMPGESVMTTAETARHKDLLTSIRQNKLEKYLMDNYVNPKLTGILANSTASNMANSAKLNFPDEYALARVMSRSKGVNVQNADYIANRIADAINKNAVKRTWS